MIAAIGITALAAVVDLRSGRIPNAITYPALLLGLALGFWPGAEVGIEARLAGLAIAFLPSLALFLARALGGGDVKLLAAVGALVGTPAIYAVLFWAIVAGSIIAIGLLVARGRVTETLQGLAAVVISARERSVPTIVPAMDLRFPFGTAIFAGVVCAYAPTLATLAGL